MSLLVHENKKKDLIEDGKELWLTEARDSGRVRKC
jgi:hypothetical protein